MWAVRCTANEGEDDRVAALLTELAEASRQEAGFRFYHPSRDPENPQAFLIFEIYDDQAAFEAHGATEHFHKIAVGEAFPLLESRERSFYETLD